MLSIVELNHATHTDRKSVVLDQIIFNQRYVVLEPTPGTVLAIVWMLPKLLSRLQKNVSRM